MGVVDSLKGFYFSLEGKYYEFLDWLDSHNIPVYSVVDAVESANIPSFPVFIALVVIVLALIFWFALGGFFAGDATLVLLVKDSQGIPVQNAIVAITVADHTPISASTNDNGRLEKTFPLGTELTISISKEGFDSRNLSITLSETRKEEHITLDFSVQSISKTVNLLDSVTGALYNKPVSVRFSCTLNPGFLYETTTSAGTITVTEIPDDCGTLIASPATVGISFAQGTVDYLSPGTASLAVLEEPTETGTVRITVKDSFGNGVSGINVKLMRENGTQFTPRTSGQTGVVSIESVPVGAYYIYTSDLVNNKYADYDSSVSGDIKQLGPDETIEFNAVLHEVVFGKIKLKVTDALTAGPVENASVTLIKNNIELTSNSTTVDGLVEFPISDISGNYSVRIDHPSYMILTLSNLVASDATVQAALQPATGDQVTTLEVTVIDQSNLPVENAQVQLKRNSDGSIASEVLTTGGDGRVTFLRLVPDTYYAFVVKDGFEGVTSEPVTVIERQINSVTALLVIGSGTISLEVLDDSLQAVTSASIKMIDYFSGETLEEGLNGIDGKKSFVVRADKKVFFEINSNDFVSYTTAPYSAPVDSTREIKVQLVRDIVKLEVQFLGFFVGEEQAADSLTGGQRYTAKLWLMVPESQDWEEAGVHIRTGSFEEAQKNIMESDYLYLGNARASATTILRGKSFSPPAGFAEDAKHLTTGNSKWMNAVFATPKGGVYEIEVEVQVLDTTPIGSLLPFSYRAWGKSGAAFVRFPVDSVLGNSNSTSLKQALYANTNDHYFTLGPTTLCNEQFCYIFVIQDLQNDIRSTVVDDFPAKIASNYKLFFTMISKSPFVYTAAELGIENPEGGIAFGEYQITDSQGRIIKGNANKESNVLVNVSDFGKDSSVFGEISFYTEKEGINSLMAKLNSNQQLALQKTVNIDVKAASDMNLNVLPKTIVPYLDNDLIIQVADKNSGAGISNATIELFVNNEIIVTGNTDGKGIFQYTLQSPLPGWILKIVARKTGYAEITKEMKVSSNILTIIPDSISESLTVNGVYGFEKDFIAINHSSLPLTITEASFSSEFEPLIDAVFERELEGTIMNPGSDTNFLIRIELTDQAKRLLEPVEIEGTMTILARNEEFNQTWTNNIPVNIYIGFGGEVNDQNCLLVQPGTWNIFTGSSESQSFEIKVSNSCKAGNTFVGLQDIQARLQVNGNDNELGEFVLSNDFPGNRTVNLTNSLQPIAEEIGANVDPLLTLTFIPNQTIKSGKASVSLIIQGIHLANLGPQPITAKVGVDLTVNDLASCVEVQPTNIMVYTNSPGIGYGVYNNYGYGGYGGMNDPYYSGAGYGTYSGSPYGYSGSGSSYGGYGGYGSPYGGNNYGGYATGFNRFDFSGNSNNYYNNYLSGTQSINGNPTQVDYPERIYATNYPYAGYSEPFYDTWAPYASNGMVDGYNGYQGTSANYYGNLFGNFNYNNSFYGRNNQFRITNNCTAPVEVSFDADPALLVNNNKIAIEPDTQEVVPVESTYFYGMYPLNVKAKLVGSDDKSQVIDTVNVNVMPADDPSQYENCIRLSTTKFKFNDFLQKPVTARVYNYCYSQGIRLDWDSIAFSNKGYGEQIALQEGSSGIIDAIEPIDLKTMGTQQVLEFEVFKNISYRPQTTGGPLSLGGANAYQDVYGFRTWATGAYNRVEARAQLVVRFATPQGYEQRKVFMVTVEDYWDLFGSFPTALQGNPLISPKDCLIDNALDYGACLSEDEFGKKNTYTYSARQILRVGSNPYGSNYSTTAYGNPVSGASYGGLSQSPGGIPYSSGNTYNQINQPTYAPTTYPQPYPYYAPNYTGGTVTGYNTGINAIPAEYLNVCSTQDKVTIKTQTFTKNGIKFTFSSGSSATQESRVRTSPNQTNNIRNTILSNQGVTLTIDKSKATKKGETKLSEELQVEIFRQSPFGVSYLKIPVNICVNIEKPGAIDSNAGRPEQKPGEKPVVPETPSVPNTTTAAEFYCPDGEKATGPEIYEEAFGRLLLNWDWDLGNKELDEKACDGIEKSGYFCDAVQNTISLVKKTKMVRDKLKEDAFAAALTSNNEKVTAVVGESEIDKYKNTNELLRWLKKQIIVEDNANIKTGQTTFSFAEKGEKIVFFYKSESELLDREKLDSAKYGPKINIISDENKKGTERLDAMENLLDTLRADKTIDGKGIVITLNWNAAGEDAAILNAIGAQLIKESQYVITLNEFSFLHQELKKCIDASPVTTTCVVKGKTIDNVFLGNFASYMNVKYIARHSKEITKDKKDAYYKSIEENAAWEKDITAEKAAELLGLTTSTVNLMKDNYSEQFRKDFKNYYGQSDKVADSDERELAGKVDQWKFEPISRITEPARYNAAIVYSWDNQAVTVDFNKLPASEQPTELKNVLYSLPFDASLQGQSTNPDYGIGVKEVNENIYLNDNSKPLSFGAVTLAGNYLQDLSSNETQQGKLVEITASKFDYSPTIPLAFIMTLSGAENGVLFDFENNALDKKIKWTTVTEGTGTPDNVCKNNKGNNSYSLLQQSAEGLLFLPYDMKGQVFKLVCAKEKTDLTIKQNTLFTLQDGTVKSETGTVDKEKQKAFTIPLDPINPNKKMSFKALAEAIKTKQVCVKVNETTLQLSWNPKSMLENFPVKPPASRASGPPASQPAS